MCIDVRADVCYRCVEMNIDVRHEHAVDKANWFALMTTDRYWCVYWRVRTCVLMCALMCVNGAYSFIWMCVMDMLRIKRTYEHRWEPMCIDVRMHVYRCVLMCVLVCALMCVSDKRKSILICVIHMPWQMCTDEYWCVLMCVLMCRDVLMCGLVCVLKCTDSYLCAHWMLWCCNVHYLVHTECSGVAMATIWCTLNALVCVSGYDFVHKECPVVAMCTTWCTLNALVFLCVCSGVATASISCTLNARSVGIIQLPTRSVAIDRSSIGRYDSR